MGGLFGSVKMPKPPPPVRMPDQNDPAALAAQDEARRRLLAAGGRDSTNLSGTGANAANGGAVYQGTNLGSGNGQ